jgi:aspartokinase-like uncharacterized kinase
MTNSVVVKLGGSLLDAPDLRSRLREWFCAQPTAHHVVVTGGGAFANAVRRVDALHGLGSEFCHWLCLRQMRITAEICAELLDGAVLCDDYAVLCRRLQIAGITVFDVEPFLRRDEPKLPGRQLEIGWHVTSDAIAGRLAVVTGACRLVLLKSRLPREGSGMDELSREGYVDPFLATMAGELPQVTVVDFRSRTSLTIP